MTTAHAWAFTERPSAYFVYSSYYRTHLGLESEPLFQWKEFTDLIERDYELEVTFGDLRLLGRRSRAGR